MPYDSLAARAEFSGRSLVDLRTRLLLNSVVSNTKANLIGRVILPAQETPDRKILEANHRTVGPRRGIALEDEPLLLGGTAHLNRPREFHWATVVSLATAESGSDGFSAAARAAASAADSVATSATRFNITCIFCFDFFVW